MRSPRATRCAAGARRSADGATRSGGSGTRAANGFRSSTVRAYQASTSSSSITLSDSGPEVMRRRRERLRQRHELFMSRAQRVQQILRCIVRARSTRSAVRRCVTSYSNCSSALCAAFLAWSAVSICERRRASRSRASRTSGTICVTYRIPVKTAKTPSADGTTQMELHMRRGNRSRSMARHPMTAKSSCCQSHVRRVSSASRKACSARGSWANSSRNSCSRAAVSAVEPRRLRLTRRRARRAVLALLGKDAAPVACAGADGLLALRCDSSCSRGTRPAQACRRRAAGPAMQRRRARAHVCARRRCEAVFAVKRSRASSAAVAVRISVTRFRGASSASGRSSGSGSSSASSSPVAAS